MIGCGFVGSASVFALMQSGLFTELVLIDADKNKAEGEAMDISHGIPFASPMKIYAGDYDDVSDAAIVVISAGAGQKPGETRLDLVNKNVAIFKSIIPEIAKRNFAGIMLVVASTANVTHNHPEGIKGAESTASAIYMARNGSSKEEIKAYIEREFHYDLSRTLDNIRTYYHHVESCQETVPEAIIAFLESKDFEDAIRNAVSLGGDTDTLGAITGSIAEAFYGIPAVLIAECKSRIDKGLMTDVLDEFDHVLGRSVDTYSDEVDETQANQMIEAAIDQYYIQQDKNGMLLFMEVMVTRMQQAGEVIVPYITENPFMSEEQISKVKAGDTISLDHDVRLKIETVKDADEKEWIGVFTSSEEMHKGSAGNVQMNQSIESILRLALNWEQVNGIVINPFGKYIQMTKKMIELLINGYEYNENERKSKDDENN